ncbi:uncharacterized protein ACN427_005105 isoform 2-T3 [Glossina fuscipes fuscipes]
MHTLNNRNNIRPKICSKIKDDITALDAILLECFKRNLFGKYHACNDTVEDKLKLLRKIFGVPNHQSSSETWIEHLSDTNNTTSETKFIKFAFLDEIRNILTDKRPHIALSTFQKFMDRLDFETLKETENLNEHVLYEGVDNCRDNYSYDDMKMDTNIENNDIVVTKAIQETRFTCKREEERYFENEEILISDSTNAIDNEMLQRILLADMGNDVQASYAYRSDHRDSDIKQESITNDTMEDIPPVMEYEKNRFSFKHISTELQQESTRNKNDNSNNNNNNNNNNNMEQSKSNDNLLENHKLEGVVEASEIFDLLKFLERNDDEIEEIKMSEKRKQADESSINQLITKAHFNSKRKKLRCCVNTSYDNLMEFHQKTHITDLTDESSLIVNEAKQCFKGTSIDVIDLNGKCENYVITTKTCNNNNNNNSCDSCNNKSVTESDKNLRKSIESDELDDNKTFLVENSLDSDEFSEDFDFLRIMQEVEIADKALHNEDDPKNLRKEERNDHHYADNDDDIIVIEDSDSEDGKSFSVNNSCISNIEGTIATTTTATTTTTITPTTTTKALDESGDCNVKITNNYDAVLHLYKIKRFLLKKGNRKGFKLVQQLQEVFLRNGF